MRARRLKPAADRTHYHVMSRTIHQTFLFKPDRYKEWIYDRILYFSRIYFVDLHAVTIMDNHYHIVLAMRNPEFNEELLEARFQLAHAKKKYPPIWSEWRAKAWHQKLTDLSEFMHDLNSSIARYINGQMDKKGHVWAERFKSVLIEDGPGLLACMAYVELNPVRAKICDRANEYRWCSVGRYYQGGSTKAGVTIPAMSAFHGFDKASQRQQLFSLLVDRMVALEKGEEHALTSDLGEMRALIERTDMESLMGLAFRRTRWLVNSVILGSQEYCTGMIEKFNLQSGNLKGPTPFEVGPGLWNSRRRIGPLLE